MDKAQKADFEPSDRPLQERYDNSNAIIADLDARGAKRCGALPAPRGDAGQSA